MHKCTSATITVHIYTITIALAFNILLIYFLSPSPHSLFLSGPSHSHLTLAIVVLPPITIALDKRRRCNHQPNNTQPPPPHGKRKSYQTQLKSTQTHRKTHPKPDIATANIVVNVAVTTRSTVDKLGWAGLGFACESKLRGR